MMGRMKRLLITGGTGGLGSVVVPRLAREYDCIVLVRSAKSFGSLRGIANVTPAMDLGNLASSRPIYGLVSLAGSFAAGSSAETVKQLVDANLMTFVSAVEAAVPEMEDGGRIIAVSAAATLTFPAGIAAYTASKSALNGFVRTVANDLAPRAITANALLPTALDTPAMRGNAGSGQLVPLERVAEWIVFLLSPDGAGVTGQLIVMSGSNPQG